MRAMDGMLRNGLENGFTMLELLMVMAIAAILLAIGVPSFKYVTTSNRISTEVNGLLGDMEYARSLAIKEGLPVTVCSSLSGTQCDGGNLWQSGWIVFPDPNSNHQLVNGEAPVRTSPSFSSASSSSDTFEPAAGNFSAITFNREGYAATGSATIVTLELHDSTSNPQWTRCLAITPVGMLSTEKVNPSTSCQ
jgi:type IV fimbrial biogenesis protein FimT